MKPNPLLLLTLLSVGILTAGCASTPERPPERTVVVSPPSNTNTVDAMVEVQELRAEIARLRNELEIQNNEMEKVKRRQRELYDDLDYRLRSQEGGSRTAYDDVTLAPSARSGSDPDPNIDATADDQYGAITEPSTTSDVGMGSSTTMNTGTTQDPGAQTTMQDSTAVTEITVGDPATTTVAARTPTTATTGATAATGLTIPGSVGTQAAVATTEEQAAYDEAFDLLKQSRYNESVAAFQALVISYPNGALADDAQYWVGEAKYVTRDFDGALKAFQNVVTRYPQSQRVPEAMLKLGYIQYEIGAKDDARQTLTEVVNRYPGSRVAISAQTRLRKLQSEGG